MSQKYNFSNSDYQLKENSSIVNNRNAKIDKQNLVFPISISKNHLLLIILSMSLYIAFNLYQTKKIEEKNMLLEKRISILQKKKDEINNQKFDEKKIMQEIDKLLG